MDLWNIKDLKPPPVLGCKATTKEIDIRLLDIALKNGVDFFKNQHHLSSEAALLSRTVYRLKMKFRNSKDFKAVEKLSRVLRTYLQIQITRLLENLSQSIPQGYKVNRTYTLNKNMMDYVLVRFQGLGKTLCRILETCKIVCALMQQRLRLGHFWKIAILVFASASRIFVIAKNILKYLCEMYLNLLPFSSSLNNSGVQWLPENYSFPTRLDEWLNVDWLELENAVIEIEDDESNLSYFKLTDSDDDVEFCDEYILVNDESVFYSDRFQCESPTKIESEDEDSINEKNEVITVNDELEKTKLVHFLLSEKNDLDVGEVINVSDVINEDEVIEISDEPRKRKRKKKKTVNRKSVGKNDDVIDVTDESRNLKKRKRNFNVNRVGHNFAANRTNVNNADFQKRKVLKRGQNRSANKSGHFVGRLRSGNNARSPKTKRKRLRVQNQWTEDA